MELCFKNDYFTYIYNYKQVIFTETTISHLNDKNLIKLLQDIEVMKYIGS